MTTPLTVTIMLLSEFIRGVKMKRYGPLILILCLLIQICACSTEREITLAEFNQYRKDDPILVTTDSISYYFKNNITSSKIIQNGNKNLVTDGVVKDDTLSFNLMIIDPNRPSTSLAKIMSKQISLQRDSIKSLYISEFDLGKTALFLGIAAAVWGIITLVTSNMPDLSGMN